jgi:hypothetical protein
LPGGARSAPTYGSGRTSCSWNFFSFSCSKTKLPWGCLQDGLGRRDTTIQEKQRKKAADDLFSKAVSSVRQPIEAFFNWLIEKTDIQRASKVRSTKGLLVHVFGKIAAAFINLIF